MLRDQLQAVVAKAIEQKFGVKITPVISYSDPKFGDFSTNAAFTVAKALKQAPPKVAEQLTSAISDLLIASAEPTPQGFINLKLTKEAWVKQLEQIDDKFAQNDSGQGKKLQVEFISANPTGPLTLANARGGYCGDVLANVLSSSGYKVEREYYVNDAGNQVEALLASLKAEAGVEAAPADKQYSGEYIAELAQTVKNDLTKPTAAATVVKTVLDKYIKPSVKQMDISFDQWFSEETELHLPGKVKKMLDKLTQAGLTEERDGAIWLKGGDKDDRERVLVKSDGAYTYLLGDVAYHWNKLEERGFDKVINLWGADHAGQVGSLQSALEMLDLKDRLDIIIFQLVRLIKDGKEFKVSKRAGTYVTVDELIEEVGSSDVARFFFLMRSADTHMDFDLDLAKERTQKNPFYYVMYSYSRAHSIMKKANTKELKSSTGLKSPTTEEKLLIRQLTILPELVNELSENYQVHKLTFYGMELAKLFHDYYEQERIIDLGAEAAGQKLLLLEKFIAAMKAYWALLGITPQERM